MRYPRDLVGKRFGKWIVLEFVSTGPLWRCRCDCGVEKVVRGKNLLSGRSQSCGCLVVESTRARLTVHGHAKSTGKHPVYIVWCRMKGRCSNPKVAAFPWYGGRGIKVCDRWVNSFQAFLSDMGDRPSPAHSIDRIDSDGDYEPTNCQWSTRDVQLQNRRTDHKDKPTDVVSRACFKARMRHGWPEALARSTPRS